MRKLKKFFFLISITLNVILLGCFILIAGKIMYLGRDAVIDKVSQAINPPFSSKRPSKYIHDFKNKDGEHDEDEHEHEEDDHDENEEHRGKKLAREFARDIISEPEIRQNFDELSKLHDELILVAGAPIFDEQKFREVFSSFSHVFEKNKKIIEEKLIFSMKGLSPKKRTGLIKAFLRRKF